MDDKDLLKNCLAQLMSSQRKDESQEDMLKRLVAEAIEQKKQESMQSQAAALPETSHDPVKNLLKVLNFQFDLDVEKERRIKAEREVEKLKQQMTEMKLKESVPSIDEAAKKLLTVLATEGKGDKLGDGKSYADPNWFPGTSKATEFNNLSDNNREKLVDKHVFNSPHSPQGDFGPHPSAPEYGRPMPHGHNMPTPHGYPQFPFRRDVDWNPGLMTGPPMYPNQNQPNFHVGGPVFPPPPEFNRSGFPKQRAYPPKNNLNQQYQGSKGPQKNQKVRPLANQRADKSEKGKANDNQKKNVPNNLNQQPKGNQQKAAATNSPKKPEVGDISTKDMKDLKDAIKANKQINNPAKVNALQFKKKKNKAAKNADGSENVENDEEDSSSGDGEETTNSNDAAGSEIASQKKKKKKKKNKANGNTGADQGEASGVNMFQTAFPTKADVDNGKVKLTQVVKDLVMIAKENDGSNVTAAPKTVQDLINFKKQYPSAQLLGLR